MSELETEWAAQEPSPAFADRVVAAALREQARPSRRRYVIGAAALAAAATATLWFATRTPASSGDVRADHRIEVALGDRAVAVLEAGAHVRWDNASVVQDSGNVFYRVERGSSTFVVHTPMADAVVLGTCFRISFNDKETAMNRRDFGAGLLGAVAATGVLVGVYEGKVRVSHADQVVTVGAGETAIADPHGVRRDTPVTATRDDGAHTAAQLRARLAAVEQEKKALEQQLAAKHDAAAKSQYDLSTDDWAKLAERGEFKYQLPCFKNDGYRPTSAQLDKLGLTAADADIIQTAYRHANEQFGKDMTAICAAAGKEFDSGACIGQMFQSIYKEGLDSAHVAFTEVDEIRAGKRPEPPVAQQSPQLRMLLLFSTGMKSFEAELVQTFGADQAHKIAYADDLCFMANAL